MASLIKDRSPGPQLDREINLLRELLRDLERVRVGQHPGRRILDDAPVLENWEVTVRTEPCLKGIVHGHPRIQDRRMTITSQLWLLAPALGYARTLSRVYALGEPAVGPEDRH
ncbi:hypothetical protein AB7783_06865 [Tardiphaga sp. 172_B4_N1_3]|uniref:hypothetical protein n=1 Tax=Tardiphaga sp. 172_B4_N1_3 TaxID=3240787 RepID=UPI003F8B4011